MKFLSIFLLAILPLACSNGSKSSSASTVYEAPAIEHDIAIDNAVSLKTVEDKETKLIKESYLLFETQDIEKSYNDIVSIVKTFEGYIQDDVANKIHYKTSRRLVVRIPTVNFQKTIDAVSKNVAYFDSKQTTLKDVTEEFIDLEARLKAKKELENRYLQLLKKAKNVKELLEIERELSLIREEIEAKQGRLKYLQNKVSLSTINIEFYKLNSESKVTKSYGSKMWNAIVSGFDGLSSFFLGILYIWPFILFVIIGFFFVKRWISKRHKK